MHNLVLRSIAVAAAVFTTPVAIAEELPAEARCDQLIEYFDYYGQSRGEGVTDGARNMTRIGARIDCDEGNYEAGIATMVALLICKRMGLPEPEQDG
ncbi:hypothetical protein [Reyranella sp.]|jgi:hypothetical protein|uniref:hypothetical protein n=1 Tax=Reyranella sp. TaxID=1929291 RepID=UPI002724F578|nr:hypothetical protein [Reyranella sp.]MDO8974221.1 hypothetical protein [Reyranella sp.]